MEFGSTFGDLSGELAGSLQIMELGAGVEVHHLRVHLIVIVHLSRLHRLVHHLSYLQHFLNCKSLSLIKALRVQSDACSLRKQGADLFDEFDTIFTLIDVVRDVGLWVVAQSKPKENVSDEGEVGLAEILHGDVAPITKGTQDFCEVAQLAIRHYYE